MRKFLSVLLAMAMVLSLTVTSFAADTAADAKAEMAGKTVILHTNDVHGAVEGYAYIRSARNGDGSQPDCDRPCSGHRR